MPGTAGTATRCRRLLDTQAPAREQHSKEALREKEETEDEKGYGGANLDRPLGESPPQQGAGAAALGVALGAGGIASAVGGTTPSAAEADKTQEPAYTSSVTVADTESASEADESAALAGLATITADEARDAALAAVPGTAGEVELENENGNVVYGVEITDASGASHDVKVDAGNGTVLAQEADDADDADESDEGDDEADEGPEADAGK